MRNEPRTQDTRGSAPIGGDTNRLQRLSDMSDYRVPDGDPDVRGWQVKTRDGTAIGKVDDLIIDTGPMKARYIDVELDTRSLNIDEPRHVTLPIGAARLDDDNDFVILPESTPAQISELPPSARTLNRDEELRMRRSFDERYSADGGDLYAHPYYDPARFYGTRRSGRENQDYLTRVGAQSMSEEARRQSERRH